MFYATDPSIFLWIHGSRELKLPNNTHNTEFCRKPSPAPRTSTRQKMPGSSDNVFCPDAFCFKSVICSFVSSSGILYLSTYLFCFVYFFYSYLKRAAMLGLGWGCFSVRAQVASFLGHIRVWLTVWSGFRFMPGMVLEVVSTFRVGLGVGAPPPQGPDKDCAGLWSVSKGYVWLIRGSNFRIGSFLAVVGIRFRVGFLCDANGVGCASGPGRKSVSMRNFHCLLHSSLNIGPLCLRPDSDRPAWAPDHLSGPFIPWTTFV